LKELKIAFIEGANIFLHPTPFQWRNFWNFENQKPVLFSEVSLRKGAGENRVSAFINSKKLQNIYRRLI